MVLWIYPPIAPRISHLEEIYLLWLRDHARSDGEYQCALCESVEPDFWQFLRHFHYHKRSGILSSFTPKSKRVCFIYRIWAQHAPTAIYSASAVDKATELCFLLDQETRERPSKWQPPEVLLRSTWLPAKSESEYPKRSKQRPWGTTSLCLGCAWDTEGSYSQPRGVIHLGLLESGHTSTH